MGIPFEIDNCIFVDNTATGPGGAIGSYEGSPVFTNCRFEGNSANRGGAVYSSGGLMKLSHCTFVGNAAATSGGALMMEYSRTDTVMSCTFTENEAPTGSGVSRLASNRPCFFYNSIFAFGGSGEGVYWDGDGDLYLACCDIYGNVGGDWVGDIAIQAGLGGNLSEDPIFCGDLNPDDPYTVASESPCAPEYNPACGLIGSLPVGCTVTGVAEHGPAPRPGYLLPCRPNPFNPSTTISYELVAAMPVGLRIFDATGRLVRVVIAEETAMAGRHEVVWNGRDAMGRSVPAGIYFLQLEAGGRRDVGTVALIK